MLLYGFMHIFLLFSLYVLGIGMYSLPQRGSHLVTYLFVVNIIKKIITFSSLSGFSLFICPRALPPSSGLGFRSSSSFINST